MREGDFKANHSPTGQVTKRTDGIELGQFEDDNAGYTPPRVQGVDKPTEERGNDDHQDVLLSDIDDIATHTS